MTAKPTKNAKPRARRPVRKAVPASRVEELTSSARDLAGQVQGAAARLVDKVPNLETMPKTQRRRLASFSVAIGVGLWLVGAPRILVLLAWVPAVFVGGTQAARGLARH